MSYTLSLYEDSTRNPFIFSGKDKFTRWVDVVQDEKVQEYPKKGLARMNSDLHLPKGYKLKVGKTAQLTRYDLKDNLNTKFRSTL